ncbi:hypothetical protein [Pseudidiomarina andamanensis]|uniref:Uncharacterized protein n=1 Tax=Pseudidiomarina andamanensis TaxID=1940690 RepID=A0AA92ILL8_9GAMM|nr:hypothetical protein [Pseudidiomarina andamanensis]MDS0218669.1 hypothetical protein [Pseudidiomarina andamanensis]QGT95533.1 hypothetical protein D3795_04770 [Pseudidiomarina andamanensis]
MTDAVEYIQSPLCQHYTADGLTVSIDIYRTEDSNWILEIVDADNNSTVWEDHFETDAEALDEALDALKQEGIHAFVGTFG